MIVLVLFLLGAHLPQNLTPRYCRFTPIPTNRMILKRPNYCPRKRLHEDFTAPSA
jgi:hypothetical protein